MKMTAHNIPRWLRHTEKQGFYVFQVADPADPKDGKAVPFSFMFVFRVTQQPSVEVRREPDVVEPVALV